MQRNQPTKKNRRLRELFWVVDSISRDPLLKTNFLTVFIPQRVTSTLPVLGHPSILFALQRVNPETPRELSWGEST